MGHPHRRIVFWRALRKVPWVGGTLTRSPPVLENKRTYIFLELTCHKNIFIQDVTFFFHLLKKYFFNTHLGYSFNFTVVYFCLIKEGIPPPSGGIVGKNWSTRNIALPCYYSDDCQGYLYTSGEHFRLCSPQSLLVLVQVRHSMLQEQAQGLPESRLELYSCRDP